VECSILATATEKLPHTNTRSGVRACSRPRLTNLLKAGGSAQKDVDQATSDQQTAEGNYKAARNAVRIFGKTDAEIDQIVEMRKLDSTLLVPSPISGRIVTRSAAPGS
jgi:cobalt-zinc-cadmium efflux system membrane fusion protein